MSEKKRIIEAIFLKSDYIINGVKNIHLGDENPRVWEDLIPNALRITITHINRIKDSGVASVVDVHSKNWPGFLITIDFETENVENNTIDISSYRLYIPEIGMAGIMYSDIPIEEDSPEVTAE